MNSNIIIIAIILIVLIVVVGFIFINRSVDEPVFCTMDVKQCPDGSYVGRDFNNNCEFFPCPNDNIFCTLDAKQCPDGSYVGRDPNNNCEFFPCPTLE